MKTTMYEPAAGLLAAPPSRCDCEPGEREAREQRGERSDCSLLGLTTRPSNDKPGAMSASSAPLAPARPTPEPPARVLKTSSSGARRPCAGPGAGRNGRSRRAGARRAPSKRFTRSTASYTREHRLAARLAGVRHRRGPLGRPRRALRDRPAGAPAHAPRPPRPSKPMAPHGGFALPDDFPPGFENYHNYAEMTANLQALAAAHPQFVRLITLGNSYREPEHHRRAHLGRRERRPVRAGRLLRRPASRARAHDRRGHPRACPSLRRVVAGQRPLARLLAPDLHLPEPEPGRLGIRHRDGQLPHVAQEPPAEPARQSDRQQPELQLPVGLLRRLERQRRQRDVPRHEPRCRPPRTCGCSTS